MTMPSFSQREQILEARKRGAILTKLYVIDPNPISDKELLLEMQADYKEYKFNSLEIQRVLKYLAGHELTTVQFINNEWVTAISSKGVDYSQGIGDDMPGVYRGQT